MLASGPWDVFLLLGFVQSGAQELNQDEAQAPPRPVATPQASSQHWVPLSFSVRTQEVAWTGQHFDEHIKPDTDLLCVKIHTLAWERQILLPILSMLPSTQQGPNGKLELDALVTQSTQAKDVILWAEKKSSNVTDFQGRAFFHSRQEVTS